VTEDVVRLAKDGNELVTPLTYVDAVYRAEDPGAEWVIRLSCFVSRNDRTGGLFLTKEIPPGYVDTMFKARWY
jgi:hypothetical protein